MHRNFTAFLLAMLWIWVGIPSQSAAAAVSTYINPVGDTPIHMGDPFAFWHEGKYYLIGTTAPNEGFHCYESSDLAHWKLKGGAWRKTTNSWAVGAFWAPEVKIYRGKFYLTYSGIVRGSNRAELRMALAVSETPEGPYRDLYAPWFDRGYSTIDGHIFVDDDGTPYLYFSRNGAQDGYGFGINYGVQLERDLSKPVGEPVKLIKASQPWERVNWKENRCNEGATVLKHNGRYYMTYSANHTGYPHYGVGYATADKPLGAWTKAEENPILATHLDIGVSAPGHNSIVRSPDGKEMFIVYHTHADPKKPSEDRVVNIDRLEFTTDGKLRVKGPTRSPQPLPSGVQAFGPFSYQNPIDFSYPYFDGSLERKITELRDPAIIREGDTYYLTFTAFPFTHSDSRKADEPDYNSPPGIMLYSSPDLKNWKFEKWLVKSADLPENCPYKHRFWASEIHKLSGRFYLIFTADNWIEDEYNKGGKIGAYVAFVGVADKVTGPYEHITWLKGAGCDSTLFGDDDGKTYAIMPFGNEYIQEVDLSGIERGDIKLVGERRMIVARDNIDVGKMTSPEYMEGPWMIKRNGKYVLFTASPYRGRKRGEQPATPPDLAQGYWVGAAVADNIWGPYKKQPQVFLGGHIAVFTGPDGNEIWSPR